MFKRVHKLILLLIFSIRLYGQTHEKIQQQDLALLRTINDRVNELNRKLPNNCKNKLFNVSWTIRASDTNNLPSKNPSELQKAFALFKTYRSPAKGCLNDNTLKLDK